MNVRLLTVSFHLSGCHSLKEKRQRLKGMRERFGRASNVAVCESGYQDSRHRAQWCFVATASSGEVVERALGEILRSIETSVDAELVDTHQEILI
ncbi:MAG: DUF503 domain-containing protein [Pseudomonadales bacterium]